MPPRSPLVRRNGFSLVELMVVLFVMGLLAGVAALSLPGDERALRDEAERFAARTVAARDEAITAARPVAVVVGGAGYYFERREAGGWIPLDPARFGLVAWRPGTAVSLAGGSLPAPAANTAPGAAPAAAERQRIVFDPVGLASSDAHVRIARGGRALAVRIARDGSVSLAAGG